MSEKLGLSSGLLDRETIVANYSPRKCAAFIYPDTALRSLYILLHKVQQNYQSTGMCPSTKLVYREVTSLQAKSHSRLSRLNHVKSCDDKKMLVHTRNSYFTSYDSYRISINQLLLNPRVRPASKRPTFFKDAGFIRLQRHRRSPRTSRPCTNPPASPRPGG
jgi:hypothetical protein